MKHLNSDIKIIVDAHADQTTIKLLNIDYRQEMAQYNIIGNESKARGVTVLIKKSCGYTTANVNLLDIENTVQFDLISPDMTVYNIVAIYAPDGNEGAKYWSALHNKVYTTNPNQLLIGDFNVTLDPYLDKTEYLSDNSHVQSRKIINSWIDNEEYLDAYRHLYPETKTYSWYWDRNVRKETEKKARLDIALITQTLMDKVVNVEYQVTSATNAINQDEIDFRLHDQYRLDQRPRKRPRTKNF